MGFTIKHLTCHICFSVCNVSQWGQHYMPPAVTLLKAHWVTGYAAFKSVLIPKLNFVHANVSMTITKLPANCLQFVRLPPFWCSSATVYSYLTAETKSYSWPNSLSWVLSLYRHGMGTILKHRPPGRS